MDITSELEKELANLIALKKVKEEIIDNQISVLKQELQRQKATTFNWGRCFQNKGYFLNNDSIIKQVIIVSGGNTNKNVFRTEKEAKSALAMAQLSHIIWVANGCEELDWEDKYKHKHFLSKGGNGIRHDTLTNAYYFLAFKTREIRDKVYVENTQLIHDYLMIDL